MLFKLQLVTLCSYYNAGLNVVKFHLNLQLVTSLQSSVILRKNMISKYVKNVDISIKNSKKKIRNYERNSYQITVVIYVDNQLMESILLGIR